MEIWFLDLVLLLSSCVLSVSLGQRACVNFKKYNTHVNKSPIPSNVLTPFVLLTCYTI
jgi:hypothetical protein